MTQNEDVNSYMANTSVSQTLGPVPAPGINYTGPRKMKIQIVFLAFLGLAFGKCLPHVSLHHDIKEFAKFLPMDKLFEITLDYLHHDHEVMEFVEHIQSEEFPKIHTFIEHMREHMEMNVPCFHFFNEHGFDVYEIVHHIHHVLHLPEYDPTHRTYTGVGFHGLFEDMLSVLPLKEMKAHLVEKMETREHLKMIVEFYHSHEFMSMMEHMRTWPEYHKMHEILREKFVDMHHIHELLRDLYWRGMHIIEHEVREFMPHYAITKIFDIVLDYLSHDLEMKEFIVHIQSEEFPKIHNIVEHLKNYREMYLPCLKYVNEHGVDVYEIVHDLHSIIHMEPTHTTRMGVGLHGLIEDVIHVLHLEELKVHFEKKMETNEHYHLMYTLFHNHEFTEMMHTLRDMPEYHELVEFLVKIGVREEHIIRTHQHTI